MAATCTICGGRRSPGSAALCRECYQARTCAYNAAEATSRLYADAVSEAYMAGYKAGLDVGVKRVGEMVLSHLRSTAPFIGGG